MARVPINFGISRNGAVRQVYAYREQSRDRSRERDRKTPRALRRAVLLPSAEFNFCPYNNWKRLLLRFVWTIPRGLVSSVCCGISILKWLVSPLSPVWLGCSARSGHPPLPSPPSPLFSPRISPRARVIHSRENTEKDYYHRHGGWDECK